MNCTSNRRIQWKTIADGPKGIYIGFSSFAYKPRPMVHESIFYGDRWTNPGTLFFTNIFIYRRGSWTLFIVTEE